jgi:[protein-PII] uridylyltransferase
VGTISSPVQAQIVSHREKVLAHAERHLLLEGRESPAERLALYKKFVKIENHRLRLKHNAGGGGREICQQRAHLVDVLLRHLFQGACDAQRLEAGNCGLALVAVGGYGRGELNPFSDVDIMFLHDTSMQVLPVQVNEVIQSVLYTLWDVGLKVGDHSTRSIPGAVRHANTDMLAKTSLLEARLVAGKAKLFDEFRETFVKRCVRGFEAAYIKDRVANQAERHTKLGQTVSLQEPNIKNGCGGLRDYQNLTWVSFFKLGVMTTEALVEKKLLEEDERRLLDRAYDFLLRVRTELHYLNKRSTDVLSLNLQFKIANDFEYPQKNILRRSEAFMRDYYQHARAIFNVTRVMAERLSLPEETAGRRLLKLLPRRKMPERFDGFVAENGVLHAEAGDVFDSDPFRLMRMFQHAQQRRLELAPDLQQLVRRRLNLVNGAFQQARPPRETFTAILSRKGEVGRILRMMHELDFLGRYVPEFRGLTCLVQHEFFHRYTADEHTLVCIEKLDAVIDTEEPRLSDYREIFQKLEDPFVLYLALLLHDTGKASNARYHAEASALFAQRVGARLQLSPARRRALVQLVDHHLTLSNVAQRRNLDDSTTIADFAGIVRGQALLDALMLLTLADGQGTSEETWSDWKESLVWQLYHHTTNYLLDGEAFYRQRRVERDELRKKVSAKLARDFGSEIEAHFNAMPDSYFHLASPADIVGHLRLFRHFLEERARDEHMALGAAVKWMPKPEQGNSEVWICTWDRRELLARIAGSFAAAQLNILSADIFTREDFLVLDIFRVCDTQFRAVTEEADQQQVEKVLHDALSREDFDFTALLEKARKREDYHLSQELDFPTRISVVNDAHPAYTVVEVQTPDRLGLLYHLLRGLASVDVNIVLSRITTEKGAAIDTFYVTNVEGRKIGGAAEVKRVQNALRVAAELAGRR